MPNWMSLSKAAHKYGVTTRDIRLSAEMKEIAAVRTPASFVVDDDSIQELLKREQVPPTCEYIDSLRQLLQNQVEICDTYAEIIRMKDQEAEAQDRIIECLRKCNDAREEQIKKVESIIKASQSGECNAKTALPYFFSFAFLRSAMNRGR